MATKRFGYLDDFSLKNTNVGIGTSTPSEKLEVIGGTRGGDVVVTGIATFASHEGILNRDTSYTGNIRIDSGESGNLSGELVVGTGLTISVGTGATSGQGSIKSLKVSNTFTPPIGGINDRPSAPQPGALYYNKDFRTIEYWDGKFWRQVDNTTRSGRMVIGGGYTTPMAAYNLMMEFININTFGNAQEFGEISDPRSNIAACSSSTRGLFGGGAPSYVNTIEYVTIASAGNSIDYGDLTVGNRAYVGSCSSSTRGMWGGGYTTSPSTGTVNIIDYVEIATIGNAVDFGDLFTGRYSTASVASPVRACWAGGNPTPYKSVIDCVTIASKGNATRFGDLTSVRRNAAGSGLSSSVRGVFGGGEGHAGGSLINDIDYITIASEGNEVYFGDLIIKRQRSAASSTAIRGVWCGGGGSPTNLNTIEYITIATTGNAADFGDTSQATNAWDGSSDSHGGLGGF